jgi:hypothetical protein
MAGCPRRPRPPASHMERLSTAPFSRGAAGHPRPRPGNGRCLPPALRRAPGPPMNRANRPFPMTPRRRARDPSGRRALRGRSGRAADCPASGRWRSPSDPLLRPAGRVDAEARTAPPVPSGSAEGPGSGCGRPHGSDLWVRRSCGAGRSGSGAASPRSDPTTHPAGRNGAARHVAAHRCAGPAAPEGLSVAELVAQGRFPHQTLMRQWSREDGRAVAEAMEAAGVTALAGRGASELPGGQRQRVWVAMTPAQETEARRGPWPASRGRVPRRSRAPPARWPGGRSPARRGLRRGAGRRPRRGSGLRWPSRTRLEPSRTRRRWGSGTPRRRRAGGS